MAATINSILCSERWTWDGEHTFLDFNDDGTGEIQCIVELNPFLGAEFEWKARESLDDTVKSDVALTNNQPQLLAQFEIEITLSRKRSRNFQSGPPANARINEACLTADAFLPQKYVIRLEKGIFLTPAWVKEGMDDHPLAQAFALRLIFDHSPYLSESEWLKLGGASESIKFWEWREFCSRRTPELKDKRKRQSSWKTCLIM